MRIALFGGSFDPIHLGHLILAERCREQARLDHVIFVPSDTGPHKPDGPKANDKQRLETIRLALSGHEPFVVSDTEIKRGGVSYTVDTLTEMAKLYEGDELFFLMGADSLEGFHSWKEPERICELAIPLVVNRPGSADADLDQFAPLVTAERLEQIKQHAVVAPLIDISSTEIRRRAESGESIRFLTPRAVEKYIETQKMYRAKKNS